jgi:signal transduction histidine kinase/ActR/RegA family two-component response regulator
MVPMTIRTRATAALLILMALAVVEGTIVLFQHRAIEQAMVRQSRNSDIRLHLEQMARSLSAMQAAQRGFVLTRDSRERDTFTQHDAEFEAFAKATLARFIDAGQAQIFESIVTRGRAWREVARSVMDGAAAGQDVMPMISGQAAPMFRELTAAIDEFEGQRNTRSEAAAQAFDSRLRTATAMLIAAPIAAIVLLLAILFATDRRVLMPLAQLAAASRRLADGDSTTPLPAERPDEVGALIGAFRQMRDAVDERASAATAATERLNASHRQLLATIDLVPSAIVILDPDGGLRLQNRAARVVLGDPPSSEFARKAYFQQFQIRDAAGRPLRVRDIAPARALAGIETIAEEIDLQRPDGGRVVILVGAVPLRDDHGRIAGAVAGFQDITRLRELDRLKDEFVSIVSHELRTPLAAIRGSLQLVLDDRTGVEDENSELLAVALKSCDRLGRIVNDMLDLSKIEAGKIDLKLAPVDAATPIRLAIEGVQSVANAAGVTLTQRAAGDLPEVLADVDRLTQAILNLISNAVKFAPRGSTVTVSAVATDDMMEFRVTDQGPGISEEDAARLFQRFQQLDSTATRKAGGTGLGLAITKGIVIEHGGEIGVDSVLGEGATFKFTIPLVESLVPVTPAAPRAPGGPPLILVAEDDPDARLVMRQTLQRHGFEVIEAADGRHALAAARRYTFDLIVLDLRMPAVHGRDVIRILRKHPATVTVPIVVVSGSASERQSLESLVLGANVFLTKPADPGGLVSDINRLLQRREAEDRS